MRRFTFIIFLAVVQLIAARVNAQAESVAPLDRAGFEHLVHHVHFTGDQLDATNRFFRQYEIDAEAFVEASKADAPNVAEIQNWLDVIRRNLRLRDALAEREAQLWAEIRLIVTDEQLVWIDVAESAWRGRLIFTGIGSGTTGRLTVSLEAILLELRGPTNELAVIAHALAPTRAERTRRLRAYDPAAAIQDAKIHLDIETKNPDAEPAERTARYHALVRERSGNTFRQLEAIDQGTDAAVRTVDALVEPRGAIEDFLALTSQRQRLFGSSWPETTTAILTRLIQSPPPSLDPVIIAEFRQLRTQLRERRDALDSVRRKHGRMQDAWTPEVQAEFKSYSETGERAMEVVKEHLPREVWGKHTRLSTNATRTSVPINSGIQPKSFRHGPAALLRLTGVDYGPMDPEAGRLCDVVRRRTNPEKANSHPPGDAEFDASIKALCDYLDVTDTVSPGENGHRILNDLILTTSHTSLLAGQSDLAPYAAIPLSVLLANAVDDIPTLSAEALSELAEHERAVLALFQSSPPAENDLANELVDSLVELNDQFLAEHGPAFGVTQSEFFMYIDLTFRPKRMAQLRRIEVELQSVIQHAATNANSEVDDFLAAAKKLEDAAAIVRRIERRTEVWMSGTHHLSTQHAPFSGWETIGVWGAAHRRIQNIDAYQSAYRRAHNIPDAGPTP